MPVSKNRRMPLTSPLPEHRPPESKPHKSQGVKILSVVNSSNIYI